eukprot:750370-Hanusia_phi.AAC.1
MDHSIGAAAATILDRVMLTDGRVLIECDFLNRIFVSARPLTVSNRAEPLALTHSGKAAAPSDSDSKSFELLGAWTLN